MTNLVDWLASLREPGQARQDPGDQDYVRAIKGCHQFDQLGVLVAAQPRGAKVWEEDEAALDPCPRRGNPVYAHMPALQFCCSLIEYTYDGWPGLEEAGAKRQEGGMGEEQPKEEEEEQP